MGSRKRVTALLTRSGETLGWALFCPACRRTHVLDHRWHFNGDVERPSFSATLRSRNGADMCHLFVYDGYVQFMLDSTHELAGLVVPLPDSDEGVLKSD